VVEEIVSRPAIPAQSFNSAESYLMVSRREKITVENTDYTSKPPALVPKPCSFGTCQGFARQPGEFNSLQQRFPDGFLAQRADPGRAEKLGWLVQVKSVEKHFIAAWG
jgi:hypothetical protein